MRNYDESHIEVRRWAAVCEYHCVGQLLIGRRVSSDIPTVHTVGRCCFPTGALFCLLPLCWRRRTPRLTRATATQSVAIASATPMAPFVFVQQRDANVPELPFPDNPDPNQCGIPTRWGGSAGLARESAGRPPGPDCAAVPTND